MLSLLLLSLAVGAALSFAMYVVRQKARAFDRLEYIDAERAEPGYPGISEYATTVAMTLRRHGREMRKVFVPRGPAALVLG